MERLPNQKILFSATSPGCFRLTEIFSDNPFLVVTMPVNIRGLSKAISSIYTGRSSNNVSISSLGKSRPCPLFLHSLCMHASVILILDVTNRNHKLVE